MVFKSINLTVMPYIKSIIKESLYDNAYEQ